MGDDKFLVQRVTDCPPQLLINDKLCNFYLEYDLLGDFWQYDRPNKEYAYAAGYKDAETKEIVVHSGGRTPDWAIRNLLNRPWNSWSLRLKDTEGTPLDVVHCDWRNRGDERIHSKLEVNRNYIVRPCYYMINKSYTHCCPMCGTEELEAEPYDTLCPDALAGSKGTVYKCKECGYTWDEKVMQM